jgi:hypothetical protein
MINLNLPNMSGAHEHQKTTDHNLIPITHNLWHNTRISIKKYQSIAKLELISSHYLQNQPTIYPRERTWSFTYSLFYFMFKLSGGQKEVSDHDWMPTIQSPWLSTYPNRPGQSNQHHQSTVNRYYLGASLMSCIRRKEDTTTIHKKTVINPFPTFFNCVLYECNMYLDRMPCMLSSIKKINNRLVAGIKDMNKGIGNMLSIIYRISIHF